MTGQFTLVAVGPYADGGFGNRPTEMLAAVEAISTGVHVITGTRMRPMRVAGLGARGGLAFIGAWPTLDTGVSGRRVIRYPWPFGALEDRFLERLVRGEVEGDDPRPVVLLVSDPKSAGAFGRLADLGPPKLVKVFDAYDAWDLSPLVRGRRRRRAVSRGYLTAARRGDLVTSNTPAMAGRLRGLGARNVHVIPNGAPPVDASSVPDEPRYLAYVGRIHERVDSELLAAVADRFPGTPLRIAGPIERVPVGWDALVARPNVVLEGPLAQAEARRLIGRSAALLVPHVVDDYTNSQDAMKAWEALASGTPVVSTMVPPVVDWPAVAGVAAKDTDGFVGAIRSVLDRADSGEADHDRADRLALASANAWPERARSLLDAVDELIET